MNKQQITFKGKLYGIYTAPGMSMQIRSESNPAKTPYLKVGSALYLKIQAHMTQAEFDALRQDEAATLDSEARAEDWAAHAERAAEAAAFYDDPRGN